jgi:hypothetical protein
MELLIINGADIFIPDDDGDRPLEWALRHHKRAAAEMLTRLELDETAQEEVSVNHGDRMKPPNEQITRPNIRVVAIMRSGEDHYAVVGIPSWRGGVSNQRTVRTGDTLRHQNILWHVTDIDPSTRTVTIAHMESDTRVVVSALRH